jgi:hypothetical protein
MRSLITIVLILFLAIVLVACDDSGERVVIEKSITYDLIGLKSIEVNGDVYTSFCKQEKDGGMVNVFGTKRIYRDKSGVEYSSYENGTCVVVFNDIMYHGFDLLEDKKLTIDELKQLEFPFEESSG